MKNILLISMLIITFFCNAQNPIKSLLNDIQETQGAYYKDLFNDLNRFEGTWIYTSNNNILTIVLQKKEMQFLDYGHISFYEDVLIGEYRYVENGIEKINTLNNLLNNHFDYYDYHLAGNSIIKPVPGNPDICLNCGPNDVKVTLAFRDPQRQIIGYEPEMIFTHYVENGIEKLRLNFRSGGMFMSGMNGEENEFSDYNIPFGVYILVRQ